MKSLYFLLALAVVVGLTGCEKISKPYIITVDRQDQKVAGNMGYLKGTPPPGEDKTGRKRELIAVDMDLVEIKGKPTKETVIVTKQGNKAIFAPFTDSADDKNIK